MKENIKKLFYKKKKNEKKKMYIFQRFLWTKKNTKSKKKDSK